MKSKNKKDIEILPESANDWPEVKITKITAFDMARQLNLQVNDNNEVVIDFGNFLQDKEDVYKGILI